MSESPQRYTGSCQCGAVHYTIASPPQMAGHCHCVDCRKSSGSGHVTLAIFDADAFTIEGNMSQYSTTADSGATFTRFFCPVCGGRLFGQTSQHPDALAVAVGTLDHPEAIQPQFRVFAKHQLPWDVMDPALASFAEMPPPKAG